MFGFSKKKKPDQVKKQKRGNHSNMPHAPSVLAAVSPDDVEGCILGQIDDGRLLQFNDRAYPERGRNILVFGRPKSGKTVSFIAPELERILQSQETVVVADPDGELYEQYYQRFWNSGYLARALDVRNPDASNHWNPIEALGPAENVVNVQKSARAIARTMVPNLLARTSNEISIAVRNIIEAVIMRIYLDPEMNNSFGFVCNTLQQCTDRDFLNQLFDAEKMDGSLRACLAPYNTFRQQDGRTSTDTLEVLKSILKPLDDDQLQKMLSENQMHIFSLAQQPCAYFIIFDKNENHYQAITALFFRLLYSRMSQLSHSEMSYPVNIILDGMSEIGVIYGFGNDLKACLRKGLPVHTIISLRNLDQLRSRYEEEWRMILNCCFIQIGMGFSDKTTATYFSRLSSNNEASSGTKEKKKRGKSDREEVGFPVRTLLGAELNDSFLIFRGVGLVKCKHWEQNPDSGQRILNQMY